ncbi:hypothetical protein L3X38_006999 [Prunus dulcis]|uniref:Uncharacterized protein n=1 Tax=Prunus dulcis TaxID=3755 RepID=A0AAD4ZTX5_PRUDU|nr:hypothetical protein L3X38_006999 [Prunus dulcis]
MAVEKIGYTRSELQKRNATCSFDLIDPRTFMVSQHGPELSYALSITRFKGIAEDFSLLDRERQSSTFRIVNINAPNVLGPVIWPGDSLSVPKGWEVPTDGKKLRLRIGVLVKAAVELLPFALPFDFIPFAKPDGTSAGSYDDLCYQVYLGKFDAVVGDTTISADRSSYM